MCVFQEGSLPGNARKKMSLILYSDHTSALTLAVSVPAPEKPIQFTEAPADPEGDAVVKETARFPLVEQV